MLQKFIENIFQLPEDKTIILSTHKIEILGKCDRIYKVENNRLEIFKQKNY